MIDRESFDEWMAHPVTEYVRAHYVALAAERRETWVASSWNGGAADPIELRVLRETARLLIHLSELKYEDIDESEDEPASG